MLVHIARVAQIPFTINHGFAGPFDLILISAVTPIVVTNLSPEHNKFQHHTRQVWNRPLANTQLSIVILQCEQIHISRGTSLDPTESVQSSCQKS